MEIKANRIVDYVLYDGDEKSIHKILQFDGVEKVIALPCDLEVITKSGVKRMTFGDHLLKRENGEIEVLPKNECLKKV